MSLGAAVLGVFVAFSLGAVGLLLAALRVRNVHVWAAAYFRGLFRGRPRVQGALHIFFAVVDHFEPAVGAASMPRQRLRVSRWVDLLPALARQFRDADGRHYQHTFFFPQEEYVSEHLDRLATLCREGLGDVEVHLHHHGDTAEGLRRRLADFTSVLHHRHGLLRREPVTGLITYGFIHGNWALDNARRDGRWCGVNNELTVLRETGCYADFTLPAAPEACQTSKINSIYYATDDPEKPKSHDTGVDVEMGRPPSGDLMIVQGPLALNWRSRVFGLVPRIENGELTADNPPTPARADLWVRQHIHVKGRPDWIIVKLHTHGALEENAAVVLGEAMRRTLDHMQRAYNDGLRFRMHFVTARELYEVIKAAEGGLELDTLNFSRDIPAASGGTAN